MSQEALTHASGYCRDCIGILERGGRRPLLRTLFNAAGALKKKGRAAPCPFERYSGSCRRSALLISCISYLRFQSWLGTLLHLKD